MDPQPGSTDGQAGSSFPAPDAEAQVASQIMLAEYVALRTEVDRRATVQWNVLALQLTSAAVIASLAISHGSDIALLLVIPLSSYMLGSRYLLHDFHLKLISRSIRDLLSGRLEGRAPDSVRISRSSSRGRRPTPNGGRYMPAQVTDAGRLTCADAAGEPKLAPLRRASVLLSSTGEPEIPMNCFHTRGCGSPW